LGSTFIFRKKQEKAVLKHARIKNGLKTASIRLFYYQALSNARPYLKSAIGFNISIDTFVKSRFFPTV
jgi:hypothetical protein